MSLERLLDIALFCKNLKPNNRTVSSAIRVVSGRDPIIALIIDSPTQGLVSGILDSKTVCINMEKMHLIRKEFRATDCSEKIRKALKNWISEESYKNYDIGNKGYFRDNKEGAFRIGTVSSLERKDHFKISHCNCVRTVTRSDIKYYREYRLDEDYMETQEPTTFNTAEIATQTLDNTADIISESRPEPAQVQPKVSHTIPEYDYSRLGAHPKVSYTTSESVLARTSYS